VELRTDGPRHRDIEELRGEWRSESMMLQANTPGNIKAGLNRIRMESRIVKAGLNIESTTKYSYQ
jgi:hypothetical protein